MIAPARGVGGWSFLAEPTPLRANLESRHLSSQLHLLHSSNGQSRHPRNQNGLITTLSERVPVSPPLAFPLTSARHTLAHPDDSHHRELEQASRWLSRRRRACAPLPERLESYERLLERSIGSETQAMAHSRVATLALNRSGAGLSPITRAAANRHPGKPWVLCSDAIERECQIQLQLQKAPPRAAHTSSEEAASPRFGCAGK